MANNYKLPKLKFSSEDLKRFEELKSQSMDDLLPGGQILVFDKDEIDTDDKVEVRKALKHIKKALKEGSDGGAYVPLIIYGDLSGQGVRRWLLDEMTDERSFLWQIVRGCVEDEELEGAPVLGHA